MYDANSAGTLLNRLEAAVSRAEAAAVRAHDDRIRAVQRYELLEHGTQQALEALDTLLTDPVRAHASAA